MRISTRVGFASLLVLFLWACTESDGGKNDGIAVGTTHGQDGLDVPLDSDGSQRYPEGWRSGTALVTLTLNQSADAKVVDDAQGGTTTLTKWDFSMSATQKIAVMIPPDFTRLLPDYNAASLDASVTAEDVFIAMDNNDAASRGEVNFRGRMEQRTPRANDITLLVMESDGRATLSNFTLDYVRPSLVGRGFEAAVSYDYKMQGSGKSRATHQGGAVLEDSLPCCEFESETLQFYPAPDQGVVDRVDYPQDDNLPKEIHEYGRQLQRDFYQALFNITNNTEPRAALHPGMTWLAAADSLSLSYHSESSNLLAQGGLYALAAPAEQRSFTLKVVLKAN